MKKIAKVSIILLTVFLALLLGAVIYCFIVIKELDTSLLSNRNLLSNFDSQLTFYDIDDNKLDFTTSSGKSFVKLDDLPKHVYQAFIAIEDKDFFSHHGLNYKRILKAVFNNIKSGYAKEGASTISQQLIKNIYLSSDKTIKRKIQEAYLTLELEKQYDKEEILETYLNVIYFGNGAIGIENAAKIFFDCSASELSLEQSATLAGMIKSPSYYSPISNKENCLKRRNLVLSQMKEQNFITEEEYEKAINSPLDLSVQNVLISASAYYQEALKQAQSILNLSEKDVALSNYKLYTYLDKDLQTNLSENFQSQIASLRSNKKIDGTLCVLDNSTASIIALVTTTNNANLKRQPASLIKPILCFAPAFEKGILSPASPIDDSNIKFGTWQPENVNGKTDGYITARKALSQSKNIPAVKTLDYVGIDNAKQIATKFGITFDAEDNHLALALGAMKHGISPLEMASSYATFANSGKYSPYSLIRKIEDANGKIIFENEANFEQAISKETAFLISDVLADTITEGTAKKLQAIPLQLSAKTGTVGAMQNNQNTDAWCVSYNKNYTVCAWVGNITGDSENNLSNNQNGGTIGANFNKLAWNNLTKRENSWFEQPDSVIKTKIDLKDWQEKHILNLANDNTPERYVMSDYFNEKFLPQKTSENFVSVTAPNLTAQKNDDEIILSWDMDRFLEYDIYENDELYDKNCTSPYSIMSNSGENRYYLVAKNKYSDAKNQSNVVKVFDETKKESSFKKIIKNWSFG